ncbi:MAG: hypothetical protein V4555_12910 [Acidobacteriota bacterium]
MNPEDSTPNPPPAEDKNFSKRHLPGTPAGESKGMLPGMAVIGVYLLVLGMFNVFAALHGAFGTGAARNSVLGICTLLVLGVFGLLRLRRWGWSLVAVACLLMAFGFFYGFVHSHIVPYIVQGLFSLVFFLYLVRPEVRERLR